MNTDKQETRKPDCVLSDGTEVFFDKHNIKMREWRSLFDPEQPEEEGEEIMARFACIPLEMMREITVYDRQLLNAAALLKMREPVEVKNLASASISP